MASEKVAYVSVPASEEDEGKRPVCKPPKGFGARHMQALILFISLTVAYTIRSQLSVTMVAMIGHTVHHDMSSNNGSIKAIINVSNFNSKTTQGWSAYRTYDWNKSTQEMIMFSFFVGYTSMMMPMGMIAQKFGGKIPILVALFVNGILSIVTPWVPIFGGWLSFCLCRLLEGMTQAAFYPSIHTILGKWSPLSERGRLSTYIYTGSQFGTVFIFQISGVFAESPFFGWPATFWLCGTLSLAAFGLLWRFGAATPHEHATISTEELTYIMEDGSADMLPKKRRTPWKHILTSTAVWGLVVAHVGSVAGYLLVLTQIPTYLNEVLGVDLKRNGLYSSLPYISMYIMTLLFGNAADFMANRKIMSVANIRRTANSIGLVLSGMFLIGFSYVDSTLPAILILILCLGTHSGVHVGFHINQIDLAPNFAGPIMALGNMVANLNSLLVPVIVSNVIKDDLRNQNKWQIVFLIIAGFQFITNAIFVTFVKGEVQPWNFYDEDANGSVKEETKALEETKTITFEEKVIPSI